MISMYAYYTNTFNELEAQGKDGFILIGSTVCVHLLSDLYKTFLKDGVEPIENIPIEKKKKYWEASKKYWGTEPEAIKASKAAYVLALITSTHE